MSASFASFTRDSFSFLARSRIICAAMKSFAAIEPSLACSLLMASR
jgi:hypothetical protein